MEIKTGLIFDMDGTLWDSSLNVARSWTEVLKDCPDAGKKEMTREDIQGVMGMTMTAIAQKFGFSESVMDKCMDYENVYLRQHGGELYPGLEESLNKLQKMLPLYIASNCQTGYIEAFLDHYGFGHFFTDHISFGDNQQNKDVNIRLLAERNGLSRYYYIGDIESDRISTEKAGGIFIHAAYGFGQVPEARYRVSSITELPDLMKDLLRKN